MQAFVFLLKSEKRTLEEKIELGVDFEEYTIL